MPVPERTLKNGFRVESIAFSLICHFFAERKTRNVNRNIVKHRLENSSKKQFNDMEARRWRNRGDHRTSSRCGVKVRVPWCHQIQDHVAVFALELVSTCRSLRVEDTTGRGRRWGLRYVTSDDSCADWTSTLPAPLAQKTPAISPTCT